MRKLLLWFALFGVASSYAQLGGNDYTTPAISPQAPEVASLLKFAETPVSYHTGIPNISIPIASLSGRELSAAVSISYHAGGHRVTEEATWVGLGWNLSAGGQISRTMRGKPDDDKTNGFIYTSNTVEYAMNECSTGGGVLPSTLCNQLTSTTPGTIGSETDYEPDEFNFSALGQSARFMFDQRRSQSAPQGNVVIFEGRGMKIVPTYNTSGITGLDGRIEAWDITDTNGNVYHFEIGNRFIMSDAFQKINGAIEISNDSGNGDSYVETWDLKTVTSPNGDVLTFHYNTPTIPNAATWNEYTCTYGSESFIFYEKTEATATATYPNKRIGTYATTKRMYTELSKITSSQGSIEFIKSNTLREDSQSQKYALKYVRVFDINNKLIKEVEFVQDYFESTPSTESEFTTANGTSLTYLSPNQDSFLNKRLYLDEVHFNEVINGVATSNHYKYRFGYNDETMLPHKRSFSRDHWGYYNGANNTNLIPYGINSQAANREVNPEFSNACVLDEIRFPEGGTTKFTFESNRGDAVLQMPAYLQKTVEVKALTSEPHTITQNGASTTYTFTKEFTISDGAKPSTTNSGKTYLEYAGMTNRCENVDALYGDGNLVCNNMFFNLYKLTPLGAVDPSFSFSVPIWQFGTIELDNDTTYRAEIVITSTNNEYTLTEHYSEMVLKWLDENTNPPSNYINYNYYGGLRVKSIKSYTKGELASYKSYNYYGGHILSVPTYVSQTGYQTKKIVSESWVPLLNSQAKYQGYEKVTETFHHTEDPNYGKGPLLKRITRSYLQPRGTGEPVFPGAPYEPLVDRSELEKEEAFNKKVTTYEYAGTNFNATEHIWGYKLTRDLPTTAFDIFTLTSLHSNYNNSISCGSYSPCAMGNNTYQIAPKINLVDKVITKNTEKKGIFQVADTLTTVTETFYDNIPNHYNPTKTRTTESNGKVLETRMEYAKELNDNTLLTENRVNTVLRTKYFKDNVLLQTVKNDYASFSGNYLMQSVGAVKSNLVFGVEPTPEQRVVYHGYYDNGNIREVSKKDGTHIVYIWGYNQTVPVAKIENATYSQVMSYVSNIQTLSNADNDRTTGTAGNEGALRVALSTLRSGLSDAMVNTYTYDPLIGVTSITDPRGNTIYYSYDGYNRLEFVKDYEGNILSENKYNYKN